MTPRRSTLVTLSTLPSTLASPLKSPRSIPPSPLLPPSPSKMTPEENFKQFCFFVRGGAAEFLNDIKQKSYEVLDDDWWKEAHQLILKRIDEHQVNNYGITRELIESMLSKLPADLLDEKQKKAFKKYIMQAYIRYNAVTKETCYCDDALCMGDCGVQACGCIDTCRCYVYNRHDRYSRWDY